MKIEVLRAGTMTTIQDWPGRLGLWNVGVPPSGPMDDRSFRLGNLAVGNPEGTPGLECTLIGPMLRFSRDAIVCVTGGEVELSLNGIPVAPWEPFVAGAGSVLDVGTPTRGMRNYVLLSGGILVERHLGSGSTFTLGRFGGQDGRALRVGDVLRSRPPFDLPNGRVLDPPDIVNDWTVAVTEGPHAAPEFFTPADIEMFYDTAWKVHFNSSRTGVRLVGPAPEWAREDGGEAGLHPSNIHDTPYSVGAVDFTGDLPIMLGPDGPSLGGFVCPATIATGERWKLGQLRPGDSVRFVPVSEATARTLRGRGRITPLKAEERDQGILGRRQASDGTPSVVYRRNGDDNIIVEYGPMALDIGVRMRVHALEARIRDDAPGGLIDLTAGIRSLQLHVDPERISVRDALTLVRELEGDIPATEDLVVPSRTVELPLSWDDPATREAIQRYMSGVRADAPWCPWNIEFIRRINGLETVEQVREIVFGAEYLVLGLGDVYLGAPVATPLDPRHRLVTTKYNPARTWTPENAVGIGGAYMCIYGMEGPGGYQFVGRTVPVWDRSGAEPPWLLRHFDRIRWVPVEADELLELRADASDGRLAIPISDGTFRFSDHAAFLVREAGTISAFRRRQADAFGAERRAWEVSGELSTKETT